MPLLDKELEDTYKIKEKYLPFDSISKDKINNYDIKSIFRLIIKRCENSHMSEMEEVGEIFINWEMKWILLLDTQIMEVHFYYGKIYKK